MGFISRILDLVIPKTQKITPTQPIRFLINDLIADSSTVLIDDEGYTETPKIDTYGNYFIGVGYNIGKSMTDLKLSRPTIMFMLKEQIDICVSELIEIFGSDSFHSWELARQVALVSMIYNLGKPRFLGFELMIAAIKTNRWLLASNEALSSKWAKDVDPQQKPGEGRDDRIAFMLRKGTFHETYKIVH